MAASLCHHDEGDGLIILCESHSQGYGLILFMFVLVLTKQMQHCFGYLSCFCQVSIWNHVDILLQIEIILMAACS
jgi:hypothetical protein